MLLRRECSLDRLWKPWIRGVCLVSTLGCFPHGKCWKCLTVIWPASNSWVKVECRDSVGNSRRENKTNGCCFGADLFWDKWLMSLLDTSAETHTLTSASKWTSNAAEDSSLLAALKTTAASFSSNGLHFSPYKIHQGLHQVSTMESEEMVEAGGPGELQKSLPKLRVLLRFLPEK